MMKGISFSNYRVFDKKTEFDLCPITILTGKNSSGKSSIMKFLKLLNANILQKGGEASILEKLDSLDFALGLNQMYTSHKLGGFSNIISRKSKNNSIEICIGFGMHKLFAKEQIIKITYGANNLENLDNAQIEQLDFIIGDKVLASLIMLPEYRGKTKKELCNIIKANENVFAKPWERYIQEIGELEIDRNGFTLVNAYCYYLSFELEDIKKMYSEVYRKGILWEMAEHLSYRIYKQTITEDDNGYIDVLKSNGLIFNVEDNQESCIEFNDIKCFPKMFTTDGIKVDFTDFKSFTQKHDVYKHGAGFLMSKDSFKYNNILLKDFTYFLYPIVKYVQGSDWVDKYGTFIRKSDERIKEIKVNKCADEKILLKYEEILKSYDNIHSLIKDINTIENYIIEEVFLKDDEGEYILSSSFTGGAYRDNKELFDLFMIMDCADEEQGYKAAIEAVSVYFENSVDIKIPKISDVLNKIEEIKSLKSCNVELAYEDAHNAFDISSITSDSKLYKEIIFSLFGKGFSSADNINVSRFLNYMSEHIMPLDSLDSLGEMKFVDAVRGNVDRFYSDSSVQTNSFVNLLMEFNKQGYSIDSKEMKFINKWIKEFEIGDCFVVERLQDSDGTKVYIQQDEDKVLLADLGFGITQFLPLLLHSVMNKGKLICIEEPETNLHPKLQSKLADMFIDANKLFRNRYLLETHSEYLIRKLQYRVVEVIDKKHVKSDDIALYYLSGKCDDNLEKVKRIRIKDNGTLDKPFGKGFLDETSNLLVGIMTRKL